MPSRWLSGLGATFTVTWLSIHIMHCLGLLVFLTVRALISLGGLLNLGSCAVP